MSRKFFIISLVILLCFSFSVNAFANKTGSISLSLPDVVGAEFSVYRIATVNVSTTPSYAYTKEFENCNIPLDDQNALSKLDAFITWEAPIKMITDANGKAMCKDLPLGLYLVKQTNTVDGFAPCKSFFVSVPNDKLVYDVDASPKTEVQELISITVKKVWNTNDNKTLPDSIAFELLRDGNVLKTETLSNQNGWQITFDNMPKSDTYSVREINIPKDFVATYSQNKYEYTITNTSSLAQTGQLVWPIPVLAMSGILLIAIGFVLLQKKRSSNA